jgi:glycosyltransferase involved in cell wall biosynthesis
MYPTKASIGIDIREARVPSGKGNYTRGLTKALIERSPQTSFILFSNHADPQWQAYPNVTVLLIPGKSLFWHWNLRKYLQKSPVDWFIAPTSYILPAFAPQGQKTVVVVHDLITFLHASDHPRFPTAVERFSLPRALKKATLIACVSGNTLQDLHRLFPESKFKPAVIVHPAVEAQNTQSQKLDLPERFILSVGTQLPRKNHLQIIRALDLLPEQTDLHLCLAGAKTSFTTTLKSKIPPHLQKRVHFLGTVNPDQLAELYARALLFVFPSLYEGFGIPPLEAMAAACPVIVSNTSSLPEVVADAALQVDPKQAQALADAITQLLKPDQAEEYRRRGLKRVKAFSWGQSAKFLLHAMGWLNE